MPYLSTPTHQLPLTHWWKKMALRHLFNLGFLGSKTWTKSIVTVCFVLSDCWLSDVEAWAALSQPPTGLICTTLYTFLTSLLLSLFWCTLNGAAPQWEISEQLSSCFFFPLQKWRNSGVKWVLLRMQHIAQRNSILLFSPSNLSASPHASRLLSAVLLAAAAAARRRVWG